MDGVQRWGGVQDQKPRKTNPLSFAHHHSHHYPPPSMDGPLLPFSVPQILFTAHFLAFRVGLRRHSINLLWGSGRRTKKYGVGGACLMVVMMVVVVVVVVVWGSGKN